MAALTSAGPWPVADADYVPYAATAVVYARVTPRLVLGATDQDPSTAVPRTPVFTRYPITP